MRLTLSDHARHEAARRGLDQTSVLAVARSPEQIEPVRAGREVRQSRVSFPPHGQVYLLRVFVDVTVDTETVVTAYRTSKVDKYWRIS